jgi:proline-specific peptidase
MNTSLPITEDYLSFCGYNVWYRVVGTDEAPGKSPLLCLHGGPGATHDYLEPLEALAGTGRRVIFYDQLGAGNSDHPKKPALWTVSLFLEELAALRRHLQLDQVHLLGQSWGGMLAMEHALTRAEGLRSLILADSLASMPQWSTETNRLRSRLPSDVQETLLNHETAGTTDDAAYQEAMLVFYRRHVCRLDPWPECLVRTFAKVAENPEVYQTMIGPSEFHVTGTLKDWDIRNRLGEISVPTLVMAGRYDEATPAITGALHRGIAGSELVIFEESAHMPHLEETDRYLEVITDFLNRVETGGGRREERG